MPTKKKKQKSKLHDIVIGVLILLIMALLVGNLVVQNKRLSTDLQWMQEEYSRVVEQNTKLHRALLVEKQLRQEATE